MTRLIDLLKFTDTRTPAEKRPFFSPEDRLRRDERDAAVLTGKYPAGTAEAESFSEYRLASLVQYPYY